MQHRGFGTRLLNEVITICKQEAIKKILLEVSIKNTRALDFYNHFGFKLYKSTAQNKLLLSFDVTLI